MVEKKKTTKNVRKRAYFGQISYYYAVHDEDGNITSEMTENEWQSKIEHEFRELVDSDTLKYFRMKFHDKDIKSDGTKKPLHVHFVVYFKEAHTVSAAMDTLGTTREKDTQIVENMANACQYLLHISKSAIKAGKHIYDESGLIEYGAFAPYHEVIKGKGQGTGLEIDGVEGDTRIKAEISQKVVAEGLSRYSVKSWIAEKSGNDEITAHHFWTKYRNQYEKDIIEYATNKADYYSAHGRDMRNVYITGFGQSGKSNLATYIANAISPKIAPFKAAAKGDDKTFDFTDGYTMQPVGILDDVEGSFFGLTEFLSDFDPKVYSSTASRMFNSQYIADYSILNSSETLSTFAQNNLVFSKGGSKFKAGLHSSLDNYPLLNTDKYTRDRLFQVMRRFKLYVEIDDGFLNVYQFRAINSKQHVFAWDLVLENEPYDPTNKTLSKSAAEKIVKILKSDPEKVNIVKSGEIQSSGFNDDGTMNKNHVSKADIAQSALDVWKGSPQPNNAVYLVKTAMELGYELPDNVDFDGLQHYFDTRMGRSATGGFLVAEAEKYYPVIMGSNAFLSNVVRGNN